MIVEDEFLIRTMIADELRSAGFQVIECRDADEAVEVLNSGAAVALVFTDIRMPGVLNGLSFAETVRAKFPTLKVVITSGELPPDRLGFTEQFVPKPYDPLAVIRVIDGLLTGTSDDPPR